MEMRFNPPLLATGLLLNLTTLNAEASLTAYNAAGNIPVVYSSVSDITWTADANLLGTMISDQGYNTVVNAIIAASPVIFDTPNYYDGSWLNYDGDNGRPYSGQYSLSVHDLAPDGYANWFGAQAFVHYLNTINYAGSNQWALPSTDANVKWGYTQTGQFGQLFYNELGGTADNNIPITANFTNVQIYAYWLDEVILYPSNARTFFTEVGYQDTWEKPGGMFVWAVSPGQVSAVPVPSAVWLFGTGLVGLLSLKRRGQTG